MSLSLTHTEAIMAGSSWVGKVFEVFSIKGPRRLLDRLLSGLKLEHHTYHSAALNVTVTFVSSYTSVPLSQNCC